MKPQVSTCQGNVAKEMESQRPVGEEESGGVHESQVKAVTRMREGPLCEMVLMG